MAIFCCRIVNLNVIRMDNGIVHKQDVSVHPKRFGCSIRQYIGDDFNWKLHYYVNIRCVEFLKVCASIHLFQI